MTDDAKPRLYHNPASYFSMIARLALAEAGIAHEEVFVDIHLRGSQQSPAYVRINPNMTVPTLALNERVIDQSRDVLSFALARRGVGFDDETQSWLDLHYSHPVEDRTFGGFLAHHALARAIIPARMAASRNRLLRLAAAHPDLADATTTGPPYSSNVNEPSIPGRRCSWRRPGEAKRSSCWVVLNGT